MKFTVIIPVLVDDEKAGLDVTTLPTDDVLAHIRERVDLATDDQRMLEQWLQNRWMVATGDNVPLHDEDGTVVCIVIRTL